MHLLEPVGRASAYVAGALLTVGILPAAAVARGDEPVIVLKVRAVHVGDGRVLEPGVVVIRDGRIASVGADAALLPEARVFELSDATITPGLIDAKAVIDSYDLMPTRTSSLRMEQPGASVPPSARIAAAPPALPAEPNTAPAEPTHEQESAETHRHVYAPSPEAAGSPGTSAAPPATGYFSADAHIDAGYEHGPCLVCGGGDVYDKLTSASGVRDGLSQAEHSSEVIPHTRVVDGVDLASPDLGRLLAQGVTTIYVSGDSDAVISSQGTILHTGGAPGRRVLQPTADVLAVMGSDSFGGGAWNRPPWRDNVSFYSRRPTTRMGVAWVFRKAFYDAQRWQQGIATQGADAPPAAAMPYLVGILKGEIALRVQARRQHDIETAIRLCDEFGLKFTLEEATDAYLCLDVLSQKGVPVVYGPIYEEARGARAWRGEAQNARLHTFKALLDARIPTALTAQELRDEDGLARQAMYAIRFGADLQDVLKAVTSTPARLLRVDKELGTVESGKRADLVVWSGEPFAATSKPVLVLAGGNVELDRTAKTR